MKRTRLQVGALAPLMTDGRRGMKGLMEGATSLLTSAAAPSRKGLACFAAIRANFHSSSRRMQMSARSFWDSEFFNVASP